MMVVHDPVVQKGDSIICRDRLFCASVYLVIMAKRKSTIQRGVFAAVRTHHFKHRRRRHHPPPPTTTTTTTTTIRRMYRVRGGGDGGGGGGGVVIS